MIKMKPLLKEKTSKAAWPFMKLSKLLDNITKQSTTASGAAGSFDVTSRSKEQVINQIDKNLELLDAYLTEAKKTFSQIKNS